MTILCDYLNHMRDVYFFDIPIFRCTIQQWSTEWGAKEMKLAEHLAKGREVTEQETRYAKDWLRSEWSAYRYGEMIGMIRLYTMGTQIRAEAFFIHNKRITRNLKNKKWKYYGKLFELSTYKDDQNRRIFERVLNRLQELTKDDSLLKNRFVDLETFSNTGQYINYKKLMVAKRHAP